MKTSGKHDRDVNTSKSIVQFVCYDSKTLFPCFAVSFSNVRHTGSIVQNTLAEVFKCIA